MTVDDTITRGSSNVFADLGFANPETHLLKAGLVTRLRNVVNDLGLTQSEAARRIGLSQPEVSRLMRGQFRDISVERLMRMLTKLGCEVDVIVRAAGMPNAAHDTFSLRPAVADG